MYHVTLSLANSQTTYADGQMQVYYGPWITDAHPDEHTQKTTSLYTLL